MNRVVSPNSGAALKQNQQHTSSPTPTLAFTPTSVLRKMTAEKDMDSSTNAINTANAANKELTKVNDCIREKLKFKSKPIVISCLLFVCFSNSNTNFQRMFSDDNQMFKFMECRECPSRVCNRCKEESACKVYHKINSYQFNQIIHSSKFWRNKKVSLIYFHFHAISID